MVSAIVSWHENTSRRFSRCFDFAVEVMLQALAELSPSIWHNQWSFILFKIQLQTLKCGNTMMKAGMWSWLSGYSFAKNGCLCNFTHKCFQYSNFFKPILGTDVAFSDLIHWCLISAILSILVLSEMWNPTPPPHLHWSFKYFNPGYPTEGITTYITFFWQGNGRFPSFFPYM